MQSAILKAESTVQQGQECLESPVHIEQNKRNSAEKERHRKAEWHLCKLFLPDFFSLTQLFLNWEVLLA